MLHASTYGVRCDAISGAAYTQAAHLLEPSMTFVLNDGI
jgi:hypothetical protein